LIKIEASADDRRAKNLHLTKAGDKRLQAGRVAWVKAQARFETQFGAKRAADFRAMLRAVIASDFSAEPSKEPEPRLRKYREVFYHG
jgi:DNA-binding MarR family transcriptional regulator